MAKIADVARLEELGFQPFPCGPDKRPRTPGDWRTSREYQWRDEDLIGVPMPEGTVAVDVDDITLFNASGLRATLPETSFQMTRRLGGIHMFYRSTRPVDQVTEGRTKGYDTRVGGKGYVIAWHPEQWVPVSEWAMAPEWLYTDHSDSRAEPPTPGAVMATRLDILSFLGRLAAQGGLTELDYYALLIRRRDAGAIVAADPDRPWTNADLAKLAAEASKWPADRDAPPILLRQPGEPEGLEGMNAADLLSRSLPPLQWRMPGLVPEGLGLIAAPPKSGKSVFAYQLSVELAFGGSVLGIPVPQAPVLYYALEDGPRRSQTRVRDMLRGRTVGIDNLNLRWSSPRLGGELEKEVDEWLDIHPGSLVIIDVLAKVRPKGSGKTTLNAYDLDYDALALLHRVTKAHPGSTVLVVTHDRKAGSEDWMTRVTGTRGVTGAADFVIYINRDRGKPIGSIVVSGRDVEDKAFDVEFSVAGWLPATLELRVGAMSTTRAHIFNWVSENGPAWPDAITKGTGLNAETVRQTVRRMEQDGQLVTKTDRLGYRAPDGDE